MAKINTKVSDNIESTVLMSTNNISDGNLVGGSLTVVYASTWATANVVSDQSLHLQAAWNYAASINAPFIIDGTYWVGLHDFNDPTIGANRPTALMAVSNSEVIFTPNSCLRLLPNDQPVHYVINFYRRNNIRIYFPIIYGDRTEHLNANGEWGNCFNIVSCKNILLYKPKAYNAWGDGYYIGREYFSNIQDDVEFITLFEPEGHDNSRNDISVCHGHDIQIIRPLGTGAGRTPPQAAIDIEPEFGNNIDVQPTLKRVIIESPKSIGKTAGILMAFFRPIGDWDVAITGCAIDYDSATPLQLLRSENAISSNGCLSIDNFKSINCFGNPLFYSWFSDNTCHVNINSFTHNKANRADIYSYKTAIRFTRSGSVCGDLTIGRLVNAGSPNCLEPFVVESNTQLSNVNVDFTSQGRSSNGGYAAEGAVILDNNVLKVKKRTLNVSNLSSADFYADEYDVNTHTSDIVFEASGNIRAKQVFSKVASANTFTLTASVGKAIINLNNSVVSSITTTTLNARVELVDAGDGNKVIISQRGNWT